ncbi:CDGSH iron-sulfur domain-containing protein 3, mitochondrial-like [Penaeus chinensis]|uniref:CDGSH iron-sulfur domain-containing protein 3, mitochondrial-like n=1 Tax=Penaeus chinensis TaxID=139456 RepID=UPI001FB8019E|nr:CDGSH iron-sulfur domain-containing protein 3, mitochondrial-like [Penaeus chinensis]
MTALRNMATTRAVSRIPALLQCRSLSTSSVACGKAMKGPDMALKEREWQLEFFQDKGKIYDKKPFKITLKEGKKYLWCCCGNSKTQPFCDGTHLSPFLKIKQKPVVFKAPKTMDVWLCNCKQSNNRPFCDGTHRRPDIQAAVKD